MATATRVLSTRQVTSTSSTAAVSRVPTDICSIDYSKILYFLWLRSPLTNVDDGAYLVDPSGDVYDYGGSYYAHYSNGRVYFRRTHTTPTALGESILPVLSTTASTAMSAIPTGV